MKKRRLCFLLFICFICLIAGCARENKPKEGESVVYRLSHNQDKLEATVCSINPQLTAETHVVDYLKELQTVPEKTNYIAPLKMGFTLDNWNIDGKKLSLNFSENYYTLDATTEVLVRASIVKTLTQIPGLDDIEFLVKGEPLKDALGQEVGCMNKDTFIQNDGNEINTYELVKIKLYFTNEGAGKLLAANREKHYSTNTPLERFVVEELIAGPSGQVEGLFPTINPATKVINVMTTDGICYVNLDEAFMNSVNTVSLDMGAHSIANSLLELGTFSKVQILINGEVMDSFQSTFELENK